MGSISTAALAQARAFAEPAALLDVLLERVKWQVQRYMRRYPDRLFVDRRGYGDDAIGRGEIRRILGQGVEPRAHQWLGELGVPELAIIDGMLERIDESILYRMQEVAECSVWPTEELRARFGLEPMELDLLLIAAAPRLSTDLMRLFTVAWADFSTKQPTAGFLADVVARDAREHRDALNALHPQRTLMRFQLLRAHGHERWHPATPLLHAPVSVPERVLDYLLQTHIEPDITHTTCHAIPGDDLIPLRESTAAEIRRLARAPRARFCLQGIPGVGRCTAMRMVGKALGQQVLEVTLRKDHPITTEVAVTVLREARLRDAILVLRADDADAPESRLLVQQALDGSYPGRVVLLQRPRASVVDVPCVRMSVPTGKLAHEHWLAALGAAGAEDRRERVVQELSRSYVLTPAGIRSCVQNAQQQSTNGADRFSAEALSNAARRVLDHEVSSLVSPHHVEATLDDVVLPAHVRTRVEEVLMDAQHRHTIFDDWGMARMSPGGRGLSVLFAGPPGTGKTLVAGVLARTLNRALYRVDLSQVVDKYIGETEKNLGRVFDDAERAQAVLLFDEADALFATRTAVKSSNDRYANLEVNYLLQRLEAFDGMSILTTNFASSIDDAFQRRIRHIIEFPVPDETSRAALWNTLLPDAAPVADDVDYEVLGEAFELTGGHIRNAIYRAALHAADGERDICQRDLFEAALRECKELGILVPDGLSDEMLGVVSEVIE